MSSTRNSAAHPGATGPSRVDARPRPRAAGIPRRGLALVLLVLLGLLGLLPGGPTGARAQDAGASPVHRLLGRVVDALRDEDVAGLSGMVDFELRSQERRFRGTELLGWDDLDELDRLQRARRTAEDWIDDKGSFLRGAMLHDFREVTDPDAGQGPVPDRVVLQGVLRSPAQGKLRDLLLTATPDGRLLDLAFGPLYVEGDNPAGPEGLLPQALAPLDALEVRWPEQVDHQEQAAARELVDLLLAAERRRERLEVTESLHRSPRPAAAALIERLGALEQGEPPETDAQATLVEALEAITGRSCDFRAQPRFGEDEGSWRGGNHREVQAWIRWHQHHGGTFLAAPIVDPLHPTYGEKPARSGPHRDDRDDHTPSLPGRGTPGDGAIPPAPVPEPPPPPSPTAGEPLPTDAPKVELRDPSPPTALPTTGLSSEAAALPLLVLSPGSDDPTRTTAGALAERLPGETRRALERWAALISRLQLAVVLTGNPDQIVFARCADRTALGAAQVIDRTWELLDGPIPMLVDDTPGPVVAILFDRDALRDGLWEPLIDGLLTLQVISDADAESLRRDPRGVTIRSRGVFVQPVWDMAGDAKSGDDEFRLDNEVAHKFAQCLLSGRCGPLPAAFPWAFGHLAELRLFDSVYQFDKDGFVAVGDHFDWDRQAARLLDKLGRRRTFSLPERVLAASARSNSLDNPQLAWATMDYLFARRTQDLAALLEDLFELHRIARPQGGAIEYEGDPEATLQVLTRRLGGVDPDELVDYLESLR